MSKRHALGQHFLTSNQVAESIVDNAGIKRTDTVLEVGTGKGILTLYLCNKAKSVISVEKDAELYARVKARFSGIKNLIIEHGDAFEMDIDFTVFVSNLPYSESRNAIEWLVQRKFSHAIVMVQKEFAQKLLSKEGKNRRAVSVLAGYCFDVEKLLDVKKTNFQPVPKVDSVVIRLEQKHTLSKDVLAAVNKLFSFRRKTVRNIAKQFGLVIDSDKRLEDLSDGEIINIAKKIT
ncbi:MAG: ribosomal RNA small subunit methyltransferase A [Thaumarchaeota archaeon]|nr:ribosomal RNA small subunit methyltransferase A [Nitrososphaerota archaeon]